jgi:FMN phosphatase YigB (HAD superfamily)
MSADSPADADIVFLFDVDNTLLDADRLVNDLHAYITHMLGAENAARYWSIHDAFRSRAGYVDYLAALQEYRLENIDDQRWLSISTFLLDYPFTQLLFPEALAVLQHCRRWGPTGIFSDGDAVFQPHKIQSSGLMATVENRVLVYVHKEQNLAEMQRHFPAHHYVMVDDKLTILTAMKTQLGPRLTTVFPRQGHYANDADIVQNNPAADITIDRIGHLLRYDKAALLNAALVKA